MPAANDRDVIVAALSAQFDALVDFGSSLDERQWAAPSDLPGWTIKDNYSHIIGTELLILGRSDPSDADGSGTDTGRVDADHVKNDIGRFNETAIDARRDRTGAEVLAELAMIAGERKAILGGLTPDDFDAESFTPVGPDTYGRFMEIRVFDCWLHEQDCRVPLGLPGHLAGPAVDVALDEMTKAMGFVVGKKAGATEGQSVRLHLTGETERVIDVRVDGKAAVVDDLGEPTATVTVPTEVWMRLVAGRLSADPAHPDIRVDGDQTLGRSVVANANYTF